jgi:hypothetical protein
MSTQLVTYIILSLPLYHASKLFSFLNKSPQPKRAFMLKSTKLLNELPLDSIDIKAQSLIDKYLKHHEILHFLALSDFVANYNLNEKNFKKWQVLLVIQSMNCNKYQNFENYYQR